MEKQQERQNLALPVSGLLLLSVTLGGLMLFDVPLKSDRPAQSSAFVRETFENETVRARLWQDPFAPTYDDPSAETSTSRGAHEIETIAAQIRNRALEPSDQAKKDAAEQNVVLMAAMVPGSSFSEDAEIRRRARQALVSALAVEGYVASSGERIGYLNTRWQLPGRLQRDSLAPGISVRVPFEWFELDRTRPDHRRAKAEWILVMWLDEEAFRDHAMLKLNELMWNLLYVRGQPQDSAIATAQLQVAELLPKVDLRLIGPSSSSTLLELMDPSDRELMTDATLDELSERFLAWLRETPEYFAEILEKSLRKLLPPSEDRTFVASDDWLRILKAGIEVFATRRSEVTPYVLDKLKIYSARATAPEALLVRQRNLAVSPNQHMGERQLTQGKIEDILYDAYQANFVSTVVRDDESAIAIVDELERRGVDLVSGSDHVALISEWDTFFGRALPFAIEAAIQFRRGEKSAGWTREGTLQLMLKGEVLSPPRVHRFSYMRGLDGSTPQSESRAQAQQNEGERQSASPWEVDVSEWERPVGTSGLDYMRRVAEKLSKLDRSLMRKGERLKAIGVVGSDVYDKLLVLQALRARFPNVIFFTTDLDARLLHPSRYPYCRNLVVVSSYGLELAAELQREIPPFRDSYQTSAFFACRLALGGVDVRHMQAQSRYVETERRATTSPSSGGADNRVANALTCHQDDLVPFLKPRLYEVARSGAYDITPAKDDSHLHPQHSDGRPSPRMFAKLSLLIVIVGLLFLPLNQNFRRFFIDRARITRRDRESLNYFTFLTLASLAVFGLLIFLDGRNGEGEPFELFQGISVWPTEFCRLLMVLLSWVLLILAIISIKVNNRKLEQADMLLPDEDRFEEPSFWERWKGIRDRGVGLWLRCSRPARQTFMRPLRHVIMEWRFFWRARKQISINAWFQEQQLRRNGQEPIEIGPLWNRYRELGRIGNRLWRCLPLVLVYLAYGWCLTLILGENHVPYRGSISGTTDRTLLMFSNLALVALTFFVVDATRLCERFVRIISYQPTSWPLTTVIKRIVDDRGVPLEDLSDFIKVQVIARRTETIGKLITYPFIVLFIALISSNGYFDNWRWPFQSLLFFGVILAYAVLCAFVLCRAAERAKSKSLGRLQQKLSKAHSSKTKDREARVAQFELMIQEIQSLRRGAFAPWFQHPIIRAVLIPFGGVGTVAVLDVVSKMSG